MPILELAKHEIQAQGYTLVSLALPETVARALALRDWPALDRVMRVETLRGGVVFDELARYASFSEIEFIIAIRSSNVEPDEDGIWHDDGSRVLAFSLSLTRDPASLEGGRLEIRHRTSGVHHELVTPPYGTMIVFATGQMGFEHKINRVARGERIIIAGWCT